MLSPIKDIIEAIKKGSMVVLVDDEDRENEGDLIIAAEYATKEAIAFMATKGCGLICLSMDTEYSNRLGLSLMNKNSKDPYSTAFTMSIDATKNITTGISAADRAETIKVALDTNSTPESIITPGHLFPLLSKEGGVLVRAGHSEASVDLAKLAGLKASAVICEIMNPDGTMARLDELKKYAYKHGLLLGSIADLIEYREKTESLVEQVKTDTIKTTHGDFDLLVYKNKLNNEEHYAVKKGVISKNDTTLVRVQHDSPLLDLQKDSYTKSDALKRLSEEDTGVLLIINETEKNQERDINNISRMYGIGAQILKDLGVQKMKLLSNSNKHYAGLSGHGLQIIEQVKV